MSLTRKHFKELAEIIGTTTNYEELVFQLKGFCKKYNSRFNVSKFNNYIIKVKNLEENKHA